jgi:hypothetical protein
VRRGKATVTLSALNTLWDLRLRIVEALSVHPKNAVVYCRSGDRWKLLEKDEATLAGGRPLLAAAILGWCTGRRSQGVDTCIRIVN